MAKSLKGGNKLTRLIARGMIRMSLLGFYTLALLELPAIVKSLNNKKDNKIKSVSKQTLKSACYVISVSFGIGILGALGSMLGPAGSLIGMGAGSVIGGYIAKRTGKALDKI